jgi:heme exporter protein D
MFNPLPDIPTIAWLIVAIVMVVLVIGWIILPFIMMNTNAYLRRVLREQERTNALLEALRSPRRVDSPDMPSVRIDPRDA